MNKNVANNSYTGKFNDAVAIKLSPDSPRYDEYMHNLKANILLIRETFRAVCTQINPDFNIDMNVFYSAIGFQEYLYIYDDDSEDIKEEKKKKMNRAQKRSNDAFRNMLNAKKMLRNENYLKLTQALINVGLPEEYICAEKITRFSFTACKKNNIVLTDENLKNFNYNAESLFDLYITEHEARKIADPDDDPVPVSTHRRIFTSALPQYILTNYYRGDKELSFIAVICFRLVLSVIKTDEQKLYKITEVLKSVSLGDIFNGMTDEEKNKFIKKQDFSSYVTQLANHVNTVEEIFPEFYAVAQQMKEDKSAQSIMNEISNNLKLLQSKQITMTDVESDSCLNMVKNLTTIMSEIQDTILTAQKDAQEQAKLAIELLNQK